MASKIIQILLALVPVLLASMINPFIEDFAMIIDDDEDEVEVETDGRKGNKHR